MNAIYPERREIQVYDSMRHYIGQQDRLRYVKGLIAALEDVLPETKGSWLYNLMECQQQEDAVNCGAYAMAFGKELITGSPQSIVHLKVYPYSFRNQAVRQLLNTTAVGQDILRRSGDNISAVFKELEDAAA